MNPAVPDGAPPRRISIYKHFCKHRTAPPCLGEALRRGALIKLQGVMIFIVRVRTPGSCPYLLSQFFMEKFTLEVLLYVLTSLQANRKSVSQSF